MFLQTKLVKKASDCKVQTKPKLVICVCVYVCVCTRARSVAPQRISESSAFPHTNRSRTARIDAKSHNSVLGYTAKTFKNSELQTFPVMSHVRYLLNSLSIPIKHNGTARFVSCLGGHIGPWRELVSHGSTTSSCST